MTVAKPEDTSSTANRDHIATKLPKLPFSFIGIVPVSNHLIYANIAVRRDNNLLR